MDTSIALLEFLKKCEAEHYSKPQVLLEFLIVGLGKEKGFFEPSFSELEANFQMMIRYNVMADLAKGICDINKIPKEELDKGVKDFINIIIKLSGKCLNEQDAKLLLTSIYKVFDIAKEQDIKGSISTEILNKHISIFEGITLSNYPTTTKLNITNVMSALVIAGAFVSLLCIIPNVKPIANIIHNLPAQSKATGLTSILKTTQKLVAQKNGIGKAIGATIGLSIAALAALTFRGAEKTKFANHRQKFRRDFIDAYYEALKRNSTEKEI